MQGKIMAEQDLKTELRRLTILQLLQLDPDYSINDAMLQQLLHYRGQGASVAMVQADLAWLEQLGLLTTRDLPGCIVAVLRSSGIDVALGTAIVPGIARPRPE
jgi:Fe2+ or Zn2+ uptake regulation protein